VDFRPDRVTGRLRGHCRLASGDVLACDALVMATGLVGPELVSGLGLAVNGEGRLITSPTLQSISDGRIFAVGDCAVMADAARPCVGVFGVRAAPILARNLMALARNTTLEPYRPQSRWLSIMDLGNGTGLAMKGQVWWLGRLALIWKRWLDLGFVRKIRGRQS